MSVDRAEGYNGTTRVRAAGTFSLGDPERAPIDLQIDVVDLELDERLRAWTPPEFAKLWDEYQPRGRVNVGVHAVRDREGGPIGFGMGVDCRDVAMTFDKFPYPLNQIKGRLTWEKGRIHVDLQTSVNGKPLTATGTIDNPGARPHVQLDFQAESLPIDKTLFDALPPDVRKVVKEFQPTGTVRGVARAEWVPPKDPRVRPLQGEAHHRRGPRPQRALRDQVGRAAVPGGEPDRPALDPPRPLDHSRTCAGATARPSSRPAARSRRTRGSGCRST